MQEKDALFNYSYLKITLNKVPIKKVIDIAIVNTLLQNYAEIRMILYALVLILVMILRPTGLFGNKEITDLKLKDFKFKKKTKEAK